MQEAIITENNDERVAVKSFISMLMDEIKNVKANNNESDEKRLLTGEEVCKILNIKRSKLYDLISKREIEFVRFSRHIMFDKKDIDKFIENNKVKTVNFFKNYSVNDLKGSKYNKKR